MKVGAFGTVLTRAAEAVVDTCLTGGACEACPTQTPERPCQVDTDRAVPTRVALTFI